MLKVVITLTGSDATPEMGKNEQTPVQRDIRYEYSVSCDPVNGPTMGKLEDAADILRKAVRDRFEELDRRVR